MDVEHIDAVNFSVHVILLLLKVFMLYFILKNIGIVKTPKNDYVSVHVAFVALFSVIYVFVECYFLLTFYKGIDLYQYEYIAVTDQIIFTCLFVYNLHQQRS